MLLSTKNSHEVRNNEKIFQPGCDEISHNKIFRQDFLYENFNWNLTGSHTVLVALKIHFKKPLNIEAWKQCHRSVNESDALFVI